MHKILFYNNASTCFEHCVLITRRSKLYYTESGIITTVGGRPVRRLREDEFSLDLCTGRPPTGVMIPDAVKHNFDFLMMS